MNKIVFTTALVFLGVISGAGMSYAAAIDAPCAVLVKADPGFQVTAKSGKMITQFRGTEEPIECGAIISTHEGTAAIRTASRVIIKFGPNTYFEFNKVEKNEEYYTLSRGQVLLKSPPQRKTLVVYTTQARVDFNGGVAWIEYDSAGKATQAASFNKSISIQNRFNPEATQMVKAGEMSGLDFSDPRVFPRQPAVMNSAVANEVLAQVKAENEERNEMIDAVDRVYEDRSKSLASELESWKDLDKTQEDGRSLASGTKKDAKPSTSESLETIQEREAAYVMEQFKKKIYGDLENGSESTRAPASVTLKQGMAKKSAKKEKLVDSELAVQKRKQDEEKKRILDQISE